MQTKHMDQLIRSDRRYLDLAGCVAHWSPDPDRKVGAIVVNRAQPSSAVGIGYNRMPTGIVRTSEQWADGDAKRETVLHAEFVALASLPQAILGTYCLYLWGAPICGQCASQAIEKGVGRIVYHYNEIGSRWLASHVHALNSLEDARCEIIRAL